MPCVFPQKHLLPSASLSTPGSRTELSKSVAVDPVQPLNKETHPVTTDNRARPNSARDQPRAGWCGRNTAFTQAGKVERAIDIAKQAVLQLFVAAHQQRSLQQSAEDDYFIEALQQGVLQQNRPTAADHEVIDSRAGHDPSRSTAIRLERGSVVSEKKKSGDLPEPDSAGEDPEQTQGSSQNGPVFTESPDPLSGVRKATGDAWKSTEGKTVSMRVYIGSIVAVIVLMMLARCGG